MKTSFASFAAVLVTLWSTSTALAETPAPTPVDASRIAVPVIPQFYYSALPPEMSRPEISSPLEEYAAKVGRESHFAIRFTGYPSPTVYVYWNGKDINYEAKTLTGKWKYYLRCAYDYCTVTIFETQPCDAGIYTFKVQNQLGFATSSATLTVSK